MIYFYHVSASCCVVVVSKGQKKKSCFHVHISVLLLDSVSITKCFIELWHTLILAYMLLCLRNENSSSGVQMMVPETPQRCPNLDFFELSPGSLLLGGSVVSLHMVRTFEATPEGTQRIVLFFKKKIVISFPALILHAADLTWSSQLQL